jgi:hypothetical protein
MEVNLMKYTLPLPRRARHKLADITIRFLK